MATMPVTFLLTHSFIYNPNCSNLKKLAKSKSVLTSLTNFRVPSHGFAQWRRGVCVLLRAWVCGVACFAGALAQVGAGGRIGGRVPAPH